MTNLTERDVWLACLGLAVVVWSASLVIYAVISDARQARAALNAITESFTEELRRVRISP